MEKDFNNYEQGLNERPTGTPPTTKAAWKEFFADYEEYTPTPEDGDDSEDIVGEEYMVASTAKPNTVVPTGEAQAPPAMEAATKADEEFKFTLHDDSYYLNRSKREWLIRGILPAKGLSMVYGPPGCGKSLLVMAWAMCIASGTQWLDRPVKQGAVVYIAAEGGDGIGLRIRAWKEQNNFPGNTGVRWIDKVVLLNESVTVDALIQNLKDAAKRPSASTHHCRHALTV